MLLGVDQTKRVNLLVRDDNTLAGNALVHGVAYVDDTLPRGAEYFHAV